MTRSILLAALLGVALAPRLADAQTHCSQLPALTPEASFPRCSETQLTVAGFPDHLHAYQWPGWQTLLDADGRPYGPGTLCEGRVSRAAAELESAAGVDRYRQFVLRRNPRYKPCDVLGALEIVDWANHVVPDLLGLSVSDTLTIINPDNTQDYKDRTGQGVWRLYKLEGDQAIIEPYPVLVARTLAGHAGFMLVTDWILQRSLGGKLPLWLHQGLVEYIGEDGTHLFNYMAEFRGDDSILFSAPLVDGILARGVDPDEAADREMFRRACYSAYLMAWQLVEHEGGLVALQDFLGRIAGGTDADAASVAVYGVDLTMLADLVDPVRNGEPGGAKMTRQSPSRLP